MFLKTLSDNDKRMKQYLITLVEKGFVPIDASIDPYDDRVCEELSRNNVAGVVKKSVLVFGVPADIWPGKFTIF